MELYHFSNWAINNTNIYYFQRLEANALFLSTVKRLDTLIDTGYGKEGVHTLAQRALKMLFMIAHKNNWNLRISDFKTGDDRRVDAETLINEVTLGLPHNDSVKLMDLYLQQNFDTSVEEALKDFEG